MKMRGMYLFSSVAGPLLLLAGFAGMVGFGIPAPYWLAAVLFGAAMILAGQRGLKQTRSPGEGDTPEMEILAQKRHRFWIFVAIACSVYAAGAFWLPIASSEMRAKLISAIMVITFGLCVGIFLYSLFSRKKP